MPKTAKSTPTAETRARVRRWKESGAARAAVRADPAAEAACRQRAEAARRRWFAPRPRLSISEWADRYRYLDEFSASGRARWRTSFVPYLREILDVIGDVRVHQVVVMKSAQVAFTQGILSNVIGYHMHQRPCPMLLVQPADSDAQEFSKDKLDPVVDATPVLRRAVKEKAKGKGANRTDTVLVKYFAGGFLRMTGAVSPKGLRRTSVRIVCFDEVDGYEVGGAGNEGDQLALGRKRTETFWDWKLVLGSTPVLKATSRIYREFQKSDQRHYHVPCPHCSDAAGEPAGWQKLEWGGADTPFGIKFEYTKEAGRRVLTPGSVYYLCRHCAGVIDERSKFGMVSQGRWIAENPGSEVPGFHINALISPFPGAGWEKLAQEWLDAQGDVSLLQTFWNLVLGLPWETPGEKVDADSLASRRHPYGDGVEVPAGAGVLVAAVDVQGKWLEVKVKGYGRGEESWLVHHERLDGEPGHEEVWRKLEALRVREWQHEGGAKMRISTMLIDTGGHNADEVHQYVKPREHLGVRAIKGSSEAGKPIIARVSKQSEKRGTRLVHIGTDGAKDTIYARLRLAEAGPRYMHFPDWVGDEYFRQLTAETAAMVRKGKQMVRKWLKPDHRRNEALDLEVYCLAGLKLLCGRFVGERLERYVMEVQAEGKRVRALQAAEADREERGAPALLPAVPPSSRPRKKGRRQMSKGV